MAWERTPVLGSGANSRRDGQMLVPGPQVSPLPVVECPGELLQELIQGLQRPITPVIPALRKLWQEGCGKFQASPSYSVK